MTTAIIAYREPNWFTKELRQRFGLNALGVSQEDIHSIIESADFRARTAKTPLSAADRTVLRAQLIEEALIGIIRWFEPGRGFSPRTYANAVMNTQQAKIVASILAKQTKEPPILDAPLDATDPLSPTFADVEPDPHGHRLMRCLPLVDWEMLLEFFTEEEFFIFESRLHNVHREIIRRELNHTPGVWKRVWRNFQRRAAFILDLTPTK